MRRQVILTRLVPGPHTIDDLSERLRRNPRIFMLTISQVICMLHGAWDLLIYSAQSTEKYHRPNLQLSSWPSICQITNPHISQPGTTVLWRMSPPAPSSIPINASSSGLCASSSLLQTSSPTSALPLPSGAPQSGQSCLKNENKALFFSCLKLSSGFLKHSLKFRSFSWAAKQHRTALLSSCPASPHPLPPAFCGSLCAGRRGSLSDLRPH